MALEVNREELLEMLQQQRGGSGAPPAAAPRVPPPAPDTARAARYPVRTERVGAQDTSDRPYQAAAGVAAIVFGGIAWYYSAQLTLDGWVAALNLVAGYARLDARLSMPGGWGGVGLTLVLGMVYSLVEVGRKPGVRRAPWLWIGIGLLFLTDIGSTVLGLLSPAADAWMATRWLAATWPAALLVAGAVTFIPEHVILAGWRAIMGRK